MDTQEQMTPEQRWNHLEELTAEVDDLSKKILLLTDEINHFIKEITKDGI